MNLVNRTAARSHGEATQAERFDAALQELGRRAKLQAAEITLLVQRLEQLRREIHEHLQTESASAPVTAAAGIGRRP